MAEIIRQKVREALKFGIQNIMIPSNGFEIDWSKGEVNHKEKSYTERINFPSVDLIWGRHRYTNSARGGNSLGGYNHIADLFVEVWNKEAENYEEIQDQIIADFEKYFGTYYYIPDKYDNHTVFSSILDSFQPFGMRSNRPLFGVSFRVILYWRTVLTDPKTTF